MQRLVLCMIAGVMILPYLSNGDRLGRFRLLPGSFAYVPELMSGLALILVIALGVRDSFRFVRPAYWMVFGALLLSIVCGVVVNHVESGPVFAGIRLYLRALPWFFLPAVFAFSEKQIRTQLLLLMALGLAQLPLAIEQRIATSDPSWGFVAITGDWTTGTLGDSGILSLFLIAAACVSAALFEKKQLRLGQFLLLFLVLLTPTTINETKATVIFLPIGLLVALVLAADPARRVKRMLGGLGLLLLFGAIFVPVYDALNAGREYSTTLGEFFLDEKNVEQYVSSSSSSAPVEQPGRADSIQVPLARVAEDPVTLAFGFGIGNVSDSAWGRAFSGRYSKEYARYLQSAMSRFIMELGLLGIGFLLILYWLIFQDCRRVARGPIALIAGLAAGWGAVVVVMLVAMFYALVEVFPAISFLFWYFSGLIAAERMRIRA